MEATPGFLLAIVVEAVAGIDRIESRIKNQESRIKNQESRIESKIKNQESRICGKPI